MTKEETIRILKNAAWLGTNEDRKKTEEAVRKAIVCIKAFDSLKAYLDGFVKGLSAFKGYEKEIATINQVKEYVMGYEKGTFKDDEE